MRALVYHGPGQKAWEEVPDPEILEGGGWVLGHKVDGTQAEFVRVLYADHSTFRIPGRVSDEQALMLADILTRGK